MEGTKIEATEFGSVAKELLDIIIENHPDDHSLQLAKGLMTVAEVVRVESKAILQNPNEEERRKQLMLAVVNLADTSEYFRDIARRLVVAVKEAENVDQSRPE